MKNRLVVIIGGGPAGIAAAIWCERLGLEHILMEAQPSLGGQLAAIHNPIVDYPGMILENGRSLIASLEQHARTAGCRMETGVTVKGIDAVRKTLQLVKTGSQSELPAAAIIIATGTGTKRLRVPGEREMLQRGESYSATRDAASFKGSKVAIVGGGDRAFEGALLLARAGVKVHLIHRSDQFRARAEFVAPVLSHPNITVLPFCTVLEIVGNLRVTGIRLRRQDGEIFLLPVAAVFVRIGVESASRIFQGQLAIDAAGYIITDEAGQTSAPGVFAIGDVCTHPVYSSIAHAVGQAMVAVKQISSQQQGG